MASSINASTTAGVVTTADTSGVLNIQTAGTTAISIDASQAVSFTNAPTVTGGTANGVAYLNGSKVLTTGSALVFDGTNLGLGGTNNSYGSQTAMTLSGTNVSRIDFRSNNTFTGTILSYQAVTEGLRLQTEAGYPITFYPAGTERARFDTGGSLLIATTAAPTTGGFARSPLSIKQLNDSSAFSGIQLEASAEQSVLGIGYNGTTFQFGTSYRGTGGYKGISFNPGGTEAVRIDTSGNLLVGTTSSSGTVGAGFKVLGGRPVTVNADTANTTTVYEVYSTGQAAYRFYVGMGGTIFATSATITPITSDERLKQNIVDYSNGLSQVLGLRPRYFEYKKEPGRKLAGFISQEVQTVMPEAIVPTREDPEMMTYSIDWYPLFVKAIQEQQSLITQLQADVAALKGA